MIKMENIISTILSIKRKVILLATVLNHQKQETSYDPGNFFVKNYNWLGGFAIYITYLLSVYFWLKICLRYYQF